MEGSPLNATALENYEVSLALALALSHSLSLTLSLARLLFVVCCLLFVVCCGIDVDLEPTSQCTAVANAINDHARRHGFPSADHAWYCIVHNVPTPRHPVEAGLLSHREPLGLAPMQ
jgi:hypothetical protein